MRHKKRERRRGKWKKALGQTKQPRYKGRERARRNQSDTVTEPKLIKVGSQVPNPTVLPFLLPPNPIFLPLPRS